VQTYGAPRILSLSPPLSPPPRRCTVKGVEIRKKRIQKEINETEEKIEAENELEKKSIHRINAREENEFYIE
jgi:hypothetical protein